MAGVIVEVVIIWGVLKACWIIAGSVVPTSVKVFDEKLVTGWVDIVDDATGLEEG